METGRGQAGELTDRFDCLGVDLRKSVSAIRLSYGLSAGGFLPGPDFAKLDGLMAKPIGATSFAFQRRPSGVGLETRSEKP